jgi:MFS family permease
MSAVVLGGAIGQWPLGRLSDTVDRRYVILGAAVSAGLAGLALSHLTTSDRATLAALGFAFGMFALPLYALTVAHANDLTSPNDYVETSSTLLLLLGMGSSIGPTLSSLADQLSARNELFTYTFAVHILIACFVAWRTTRRAPVTADLKGEFMDALVAAQTYAPIEDLKVPAGPAEDTDGQPPAERG